MRWSAQPGEKLSVFRDGELLRVAPSRSTEALLLHLLAQPSIWLSRDSLAAAIFPHSASIQAKAALRQTIKRLKNWVGEEGIQTTYDSVKLADNWSCRVDSQSLAMAAVPYELAHQLEKEWGSDPTIGWPHQEFTNLVKVTASVDVDEARSILIGGRTIFWELSSAEAREMLRLTSPRTMGSYDGALYDLLRAFYNYGLLRFDAALRHAHDAVDAARRSGQQGDARVIAALAIFAAAETGVPSAFHHWRALAKSLGENDLAIQHALAAFAWNNADYKRAEEHYDDLATLVAYEGRSARIHYWSNRYVLAAELGEISRAREAKARCEEENLQAKDARWRSVLTLGDAWCSLNSGDPDAAIKGLEDLSSRGWRTFDLYKAEGLALSYAAAGRPLEARKAWQQRKALLTQAGLKPNLRRRLLAAKLRALLP